MPYRAYGQHMEYLLRAPSARSWRQACLNGECNAVQSVFWNTKPPEELYDTENDPWEINNLAGNPDFKEDLDKMRAAQKEWISRIFDTGFIPEADLTDRLGNNSSYDYMRSGKVNLKRLLQLQRLPPWGTQENLEFLQACLHNSENAVRYWGATGLLILERKHCRPG